MRKLFFASTLILLFCFFVFGQNQQNAYCPEISLEIPKEIHWIENSNYNILVDVQGVDPFTLKYNWKLTNENKIVFFGEASYVISFITIPEMDNSTLTAIVEIQGLPKNCKNIFSASFPIAYVGDPLLADEYEKISIRKEIPHLTAIATLLKEMLKKQKIATAVFIISCSERSRKDCFGIRQNEILRYMLQKQNLSKENFRFVIGAAETNKTKVYLLPKY